MIPWWGWILIIASALILVFLFIFIVMPFLVMVIMRIGDRLEHRKYVRMAKKRNERARQLRLMQTHFMGYPLPMDQQGTLRITKFELIHNSERVSNSMLTRAYEDRARDLWIDIETMHEMETGDFIVRWKPKKEKKPRENY